MHCFLLNSLPELVRGIIICPTDMLVFLFPSGINGNTRTMDDSLNSKEPYSLVAYTHDGKKFSKYCNCRLCKVDINTQGYLWIFSFLF